MTMIRRLIVLFFCLFLPVAAFCGKKEKPELVAGVLSDVHINFARPKHDTVFLKTLEFFKAKNVDAILITGDLVNDGVEAELKRFADVYFHVFPDDKGLKGKHVERVFVYGNHDMDGHTYPGAIKRHGEEYLAHHAIGIHAAELWEKYFKEPYSPFYRKEVKGYTFLASHYVDAREAPGMAEWFKEQEDALLQTDKPVFYIQHKSPRGTVPWVADNGVSTKILGQYPNIICFSGHSHCSLVDERCIWQGSFTSVGASSLKSVGGRSYRENTGKQRKGHVSQMKVNTGALGHHGILMEVYKDRVELHRYDFYNFLPLGVWTIPTDVSQRPYDLKLRTALGAENPPQFEKRDKVSIERVTGKNRNKERVKQVKVIFPVVVSKGKSPRALDYRIVVEKMTDPSVVTMEKRVYSKRFYWAEKMEQISGVWCVFAESELPQGEPFRFAVYPEDSFYNEGKPIYSNYIVL